jgi:hypothetical protein
MVVLDPGLFTNLASISEAVRTSIEFSQLWKIFVT